MSYRLVTLAIALMSPADRGLAAEEPEAWELLTRVRDSVTAAAPLEAEFEQTFLPQGFDSGDTESGRMTLALPNCLRWDYVQPFERAYLLCGHTVYTWNPGEDAGRRQVLSAEDEQGLELIRLDVDELRARYEVELEESAAERARIRLAPREPGEIRDAEIEIDVAAERLASLTFHDAEGNRTRFEFAAYRPAAEAAALSPPSEMSWLDE